MKLRRTWFLFKVEGHSTSPTWSSVSSDHRTFYSVISPSCRQLRKDDRCPLSSISNCVEIEPCELDHKGTLRGCRSIRIVAVLSSNLLIHSLSIEATIKTFRGTTTMYNTPMLNMPRSPAKTNIFDVSILGHREHRSRVSCNSPL